MPYDLLIQNGTIVDGSGEPRYQADVAIENGRIASIGRIRGDAREVIDAEGHVAVVWYRCLRVGQGSTCDPQADAVVFAWFVDDEWLTEVIDDGEMGLCGRYPNLVFGADGRAVVVYQCSARRGDTFEFELRFARRKVLR